MEEAGNDDYQTSHMSEIFEEGMSFSGFERDALFWSRDDGTFLDISGVSGLDSITDGRGASFADLDNDGDLDVLMTPVQEVGRLLFKNNVGQDYPFVRLSLEGTKSGKDAFGAVVRIRTAAGTQTKIKAGGSGFLSASDPRLIFGLGTITESSVTVEVVWPSGRTESFSGIRPRQSVRLVEGTGAVEVLDERRFQLPDEESAADKVFRTLTLDRGEELPGISLSPMDDAPALSATTLIEPGRKTLLNFWATWCVPCATEMPELEALYEDLAAAGVDLVGINVDFGTLELVEGYLAERRISYPNYLMGEADLPKLFPSQQLTVPLTLLVDESGHVVSAYSGWFAETRTALEELIKPSAEQP